MKHPLFRPKLPEMKEQCSSCPFREGNDAEFKAVLDRLAKSQDMEPLTRGDVHCARAQIFDEVSKMGDFHCHQSAYDHEMKLKPTHEHKQCSGATRWFREGV